MIPALAPPPAPARPRVLMVGTAFAAAAAVMVFAGMIALYVSTRAASIAENGSWLPEDATVSLSPANMGLLTLFMSAVTMQWALYSIANDDRRSTYLALGVTVVLGVAFVNLMAFYFAQMGLPVADPAGVLVFAIAGAHLAMVGAGLVFIGLMTFRTLGGQYSARDREGLDAAALFWYATVAVYAVIWFAVFVTK
ncbi:hypothetical protein BH18ACT4_BH18ACT4_01540 [soil metagenome]